MKKRLYPSKQDGFCEADFATCSDDVVTEGVISACVKVPLLSPQACSVCTMCGLGLSFGGVAGTGDLDEAS